MSKQFYVWKDRNCNGVDPEWVQLTGREYFRFIKDPANKERCFVTLGNGGDSDAGVIFMEATPEEYRKWRSEYRSLFVKSFEEIVRFLRNSLDGELGTQANYHKTFQNAALYSDWRRNVSFMDRDIAWAVLIEFIGGKKEIYVSTSSAPLPVELDELEKMVKEALNIE